MRRPLFPIAELTFVVPHWARVNPEMTAAHQPLSMVPAAFAIVLCVCSICRCPAVLEVWMQTAPLGQNVLGLMQGVCSTLVATKKSLPWQTSCACGLVQNAKAQSGRSGSIGKTYTYGLQLQVPAVLPSRECRLFFNAFCPSPEGIDA